MKFPVMKCVTSATIGQQITKIIEELLEVTKADIKDKPEEFNNVRQAVSTLGVMLQLKHGITDEQMEEGHQLVVSKNTERGYSRICDFCGDQVAYHLINGKFACHECMLRKVRRM